MARWTQDRIRQRVNDLRGRLSAGQTMEEIARAWGTSKQNVSQFRKKYLGADMPMGIKRIAWNVLMIFSCLLACVGAGYSLVSRPYLGWTGAGLVIGGFIVLLIIGHIIRVKVYDTEEA